MIDIKDVLVEGSDYLISLSKLLGKKVADIHVYASHEFSKYEATLIVSEVILEDGSKVDVQGEHDAPYLTEYARYPQPNMAQEVINSLRDQMQ